LKHRYHFESLNLKKTFFFCCLIAGFASPSSFTQVSNCTNLGFELGNFVNWKGYAWIYSTSSPAKNTPRVQVTLPTSRRHVIMTDVSAYDPNTGNGLKKIPPGYRYSARLGDVITSADLNNFRCWEQSLRYTMTIDSTNALLVMKFALVLQYADDHTAKMEPRFRVQLYDQKGDTIPDCANYDVFASSGNVKGFHTFMPPDAKDPVRWRDWTTVGVNLAKYIGQSISIEFMSADCTGNFHYGYAYFVAACHPLYITVKYCAGDSVAGLTAPEGFEKYRWTNSKGTVVDSSQTIYVDNPDEGATFSCNMTSETGCTVSLQSAIVKYVLKMDFSSKMIDCKSNKVQFTNFSTSTHGTLAYKWNFGDGKTSSEENPQYTFATSGRHLVSLEVINPPSACGDTLIKEIESFSPPLVGIEGDSTYCPGNSIYLKAYGAYDYTWSTNSKADSLEVHSPGGNYWLLGRSSTGCVSDTIRRTIQEEPDWEFLNESDTTLCLGESSILMVSGAARYHWNTGDTTNSIIVAIPGRYTVIGKNTRGCEKPITIRLEEYKPPKADFNVSATTLDKKHNQLTCSLPEQEGLQYVWNMGDGSTETGSTVLHTYTVSVTQVDYTITLTATNQYGCTAGSSAIVDVVPFIPNVFTPNGDGINDIFMPGTDLQLFDRNGLILYDGTAGWDGKYKGQPADPDTYFYLINYTDRNQQIQQRKGYVTLVR